MHRPTVGYCVPVIPELASYRLRVEIPAPHTGFEYCIGTTGSITFFFKDGHPALAKALPGPVVYDVVNDHFTKSAYHAMCEAATVVTCASERMAAVVKEHTGRDAVVIPDPYENTIRPARCWGNGVLWFGHQANLHTMKPRDGMTLCTGDAWSLKAERDCLEDTAVVYLTGTPTASANRVVKALRAGRFVVTPGGVSSWDEFKDFIWIGDVEEGIAWALNNREEACSKITAGQRYSERFSPTAIGKLWGNLFASILARDTSSTKAG